MGPIRALGIVTGQPFSDPDSGLRAGFKCVEINAFIFQRPPKPFDHPIIYPATLIDSADITPDYSPIEAGLGGRVHLKRGGDFIGRAVLAAQKSTGVDRRLCCFGSADDLPVYGGETILLGDKVVSLATSAAYGYSLARTILYGYLPVALCDHADFTLEAFGAPYPIKQVKAPLYDPSNCRLKS